MIRQVGGPSRPPTWFFALRRSWEPRDPIFEIRSILTIMSYARFTGTQRYLMPQNADASLALVGSAIVALATYVVGVVTVESIHRWEYVQDTQKAI